MIVLSYSQYNNHNFNRMRGEKVPNNMGLQIKSVGRGGRLILSLMAVFAFVAQPMYGLVASRVANAVPGATDILAPTEVIAQSDIDGKSVKSPQGYNITLSAKDDVGLERFDVTLWRKNDNRSDAKTILGSWGASIGEFEKTNATRTINILDNIWYDENKKLPDDEYIVYFTATDLTKKATNGNSIVFKVDKAAPPRVPLADFTATPSGTKVNNGDYTKEQYFKFDLKSSDDVVRYQLKYWNDIDKSQFKKDRPWNPTDTSWSGHMTKLGEYNDLFTQGEGKHYFSFSACDVAGNCSAYSEPFVVTYDKTPPTVGLSAPTNLTSAKSVDVIGFANDDNFNYYACYITTKQPIKAFGVDWGVESEPKPYINNEWASLSRDGCGTTWTEKGSSGSHEKLGSFDIAELPDGSYTIHVHAHDKAGNVVEGTTAFTIDRTPPIVTIVNPVDKSIYNSDVELRATIKDDRLLRYHLTITLDGNPLNISGVTGTIYSGEFEDSKLLTTFTQEGKYIVKLEARDEAGNKNGSPAQDGDSVKTIAFTIDKTPPTVEITNSSEKGVSGRVTDNLSGVKSVEVSLDGGETWEDNGAKVDEGAWSFEFSSELTVGVHDITVRATDNADNFNGADTASAWAEERIEVKSKDTLEPKPPIPSTTPDASIPPIQPTPPPTINPFAAPASVDLTPATSSNVLADEDRAGDGLAQARSNDSGVLDADDSRTGADGQSDGKSGWSLANLVMAIVSGVIGLIALFGLGKKEGRAGRVLVVVISAGVIATFLVREDVTRSVELVNLWTIAFVAAPIAQVALLGKITKSDTKK